MTAKEFQAGRIIAIRLARGEEIVTSILDAAKQYDIQAGVVNGIGAVSDAVVALFNPADKKYYSNEFHEPLEVTSLSGNLSTMDGKPYAHLHITLGTTDGKARGGHLVSATIGGTAEIFIQVLTGEIDRKYSEQDGLNLMSF
jgi:predicted DNA-binding protein with PD1-like motif